MNHLSTNDKIINYDGIVLPPHIRRETEKAKPILRISAAVYLRLSKDDGKYKIESASIETQRDITTNFAANSGFEIFDTYTNDGYTGTNFDRPDWKRMIADVDSGKVNMVICKDLSRLVRDTVEFGIFHNTYCVEKKLRLISVSDGIDTSADGYDTIMDVLSMYNSWYPKDISKKTRWAKASYAIVLENIQYYTILASEDERALSSRLYKALLVEEKADVKARTKELSSAKLKLEMLQQKIERLYDEKFEKGMDEEIFKSMQAKYSLEKIKLSDELAVLEIKVGKTRSAEKSISDWMDAIKHAINIDSLSREVLSALIDHIIVYEREKVGSEVRQRVEIFYKFIGNLSTASDGNERMAKTEYKGKK